MNRLRFLLEKANTLELNDVHDVLIGAQKDTLKSCKIGIWDVNVVKTEKDAIVTIKSPYQTFTVILKNNNPYPIVTMDGASTSVRTKVKDNKIMASYVTPEMSDIDTLTDPQFNTVGLSQKEIDAITNEFSKHGILVNRTPGYLILSALDASEFDIPNLNKYANRLYYPTTQEDTPESPTISYPYKQTKQDKRIKTEYNLGSVEAAEIMSQTPLYINETLKESLPVIDPASADKTNEVLNSIDKRTFNGIRELYNNGINELLDDRQFVNALKDNNISAMREILGIQPTEDVNKSLKILFGPFASTKNLRKMVAIDEDPILTPTGEIDVFKDPNTNSLSKALTVADEYIRYNDIYDARYNVFSSRGERMYAEGSDNFQANTVLRENLRFAPTDASKIDKADYTTSLMESIGGALVEDGVVNAGKNKYTSNELVDIATKYTYDGDYSEATPRVKNYLRALDNVDNHGVVDTGASVTIDATFSGLAVNSAITGKTNHLGMINIDVGDHTEKESLRDLYSEVGSPLINKLKEHGFDAHEARKISKKAIMAAMYNSSNISRYRTTMNEIKNAVASKYGRTEADKVAKDCSDAVMETAIEAEHVLGSTIREKEILSLCNKGIIKVYKPNDKGKPVEFSPETEDDLKQVAGVQIIKPDGTSSVLTNGQDKVYSKRGKIFVERNDHVIPYTETTRISDNNIENTTRSKKLLDNVSTAIARTYDSYVASYVVKKLHDEGVPVVTTHDAFTVPVYAQERTRDLYNEAINNIYRFGGSDITVDARDNLSVE